ncbi:MAG: hypothetical protein RL539_892, partial [Pseudomonadota bacterium]
MARLARCDGAEFILSFTWNVDGLLWLVSPKPGLDGVLALKPGIQENVLKFQRYRVISLHGWR